MHEIEFIRKEKKGNGNTVLMLASPAVILAIETERVGVCTTTVRIAEHWEIRHSWIEREQSREDRDGRERETGRGRDKRQYPTPWQGFTFGLGVLLKVSPPCQGMG